MLKINLIKILNLVIKHNKSNVVKLYDTNEDFLVALCIWGVTLDKPAAMLYIFVESCLLEDILKTLEWRINAL